MKKFLMASVFVAALFAAAPGRAQPANHCVTPAEFAALPPVVPHDSYTGDRLKRYVAAFNMITNSSQDPAEFSEIDVYHTNGATYWVFFTGGCLAGRNDEDVGDLDRMIVNLIDGQSL